MYWGAGYFATAQYARPVALFRYRSIRALATPISLSLNTAPLAVLCAHCVARIRTAFFYGRLGSSRAIADQWSLFCKDPQNRYDSHRAPQRCGVVLRLLKGDYDEQTACYAMRMWFCARAMEQFSLCRRRGRSSLAARRTRLDDSSRNGYDDASHGLSQ